MLDNRQLRVLSIAHRAVKTSIGRQRYFPFADWDDLDVYLVVPHRWREDGTTMVADVATTAAV